MNLMTAFHFLTFVETETARSERVTEVFKDFQDNLFTGITEVQESGAVLFAIFVRGKDRDFISSEFQGGTD